MTFRTVGQALRWYARATAQADGLKAIWPDPDAVQQAHGKARDQEAMLLTIWAIRDALDLLEPKDQELLLQVRVYDLPLATLVDRRGRRMADAVAVAEWRVEAAERIVAKRLRAEGLLESREGGTYGGGRAAGAGSTQ